MLRLQDKRFKRAVLISVSVHVVLFIMLVVSPYLPKPRRQGLVHYVELSSFGGGRRRRPPRRRGEPAAGPEERE